MREWSKQEEKVSLNRHPSKPLVAYFSSRKAFNIESWRNFLLDIDAENVERRKKNVELGSGLKNKYDLFARARYNIYNVNES